MPRILCTLLLLSLILCACSPGDLSPLPPLAPSVTESNASTSVSEPPVTNVIPVETKSVLPPTKLIATLATPHIEQGPDGNSSLPTTEPYSCGYQWAYQDLPELSSDFLTSLQTLQPEAQGNAFAFGENCLRADGSVDRFVLMETDFNITLQVNNTLDVSELGGWIVKVMQVIEDIPDDHIIGPRPGRVSLGFQSNSGQAHITFYIDQYRALSPGLSNADIYQALQTP
jgi:hypothetical protein